MSFAKVDCFTIPHISPENIYAFIKSLTDISDEPLKIDIDPSDGELGFSTALETIIDDASLPIETRQQATAMYNSEHIRCW